jgi:hypothetical protein
VNTIDGGHKIVILLLTSWRTPQTTVEAIFTSSSRTKFVDCTDVHYSKVHGRVRGWPPTQREERPREEMPREY